MTISSNHVALRPDANDTSAGTDTTMRPGEPLLEVVDLIAGYGDLAAVRRLNLELHAGEVVALLGPNGAGKTTTLLTIAGELPKMGGEIRYEGQPLKGPLHKRVQRGLAFVPEERAVFMGLSVADNLKIGGQPDRVLEIFPELKPLLSRRAGLLSGGEQQMLTVGRALALRPKVLLVDELSVGLAPLAVDRLLEAIRVAARQDNTAVLLVEQQARRAMEVADRWYLLRRGVLACSGTADDTESLWDSFIA
jgi:branched-chain amino acid transport system ATP-binding protein